MIGQPGTRMSSVMMRDCAFKCGRSTPQPIWPGMRVTDDMHTGLLSTAAFSGDIWSARKPVKVGLYFRETGFVTASCNVLLRRLSVV